MLAFESIRAVDGGVGMKVTLFSVAPGERKRECVRPDYEENE